MCKKLFARFFCALIMLQSVFLISIKAEATEIVCVVPVEDVPYSFLEEYNVMFMGIENSVYEVSGVLESISVSNQGRFALCHADGILHHIDLYDTDCDLINRLVLEESGSVLVTFDETDDKLIILPFRKRVMIKVSDSGEYLDAALVANASDAANRLTALKSFQKECGGKIYSFHGKNILSSASQSFTVTSSAGEVLYKYAGAGLDVRVLLTVVLMLVLVVRGSYVLKKRK